MKLYCASFDCKYNDDHNKCTAKKVSLTACDIETLWDGRQSFWRCKQYEESEEAQKIKAEVEAFFGRKS